MLLIAPLFETKYYHSIISGVDSTVLGILIPLHAPSVDPLILDCTFGLGKIWNGCNYRPDYKMDLRHLVGISVNGDFMRFPFRDESLDVIVFDPPHLPAAAASKNSSGMWRNRYGIISDCKEREGDNVIPYFRPFLIEAARVLKPEGIVLAKIADLVHNHRYQWQQVGFVNACMETDLTPCDMMIKQDARAGRLKSSKWKNPKHLRRAHCYWIVVRKGRCERKTAEPGPA